MDYSYNDKKEIYNKLSQIVELKKDDTQFIKRLMKQKQIQADMNNGLVTQPSLHIDVYAAQTGRMNSVNE